jgi:hypothetical protein
MVGRNLINNGAWPNTKTRGTQIPQSIKQYFTGIWFEGLVNI